MKYYIQSQLKQSLSVIEEMLKSDVLGDEVLAAAQVCIKSLNSGGKIFLAGNGGSAADAQHIAGEFVSRFAFDRPGLPAIALTVDTSILTAIGNDYGYHMLFARQLQALGKANDIFFAYSTSGKSPNIIEAVKQAKLLGITTIAMTGIVQNAPLAEMCDLAIQIPSLDTPKIQEGHLIVGHTICGLVENAMFLKGA